MTDYFQSVQKALHKHYGENVPLLVSSRKDKKFMVINPDGKKVHFGQYGYSDWHIHQDTHRRRLFQIRNARWRDAPKWSPAHLSYYVLW